MRFYHEWAERIAAGAWSDGEAFYGMPGYAYLLAFGYSVGLPPLGFQVLQCAADAVVAPLISWIAFVCIKNAKHHGGAKVDVALGNRFSFRDPACYAIAIPGLVYAFLVPAQAFSIILMPTAYLLAVFWGLVLWVVARADRARWCEWLLCGLVLGVAATLIATILFLIPLLLAAAILRGNPEHGLPRPLTHAALLVCGVAVAVSPVALHNYVIAREPVLFSAHGGLNFYMGNHAQATGYPRIPEGLGADQEGLLWDSITLAREQTGRELSRAEVSDFWAEKGRQFLREQPMAWVKIKAVTFGNFWNRFQYDDLSVIKLFRMEGILSPGFGFGLISLLALPAFFVAWRWFPASRWVIAAVLLHMAAVLTVFVTERYRLPAVPGMLVVAGLGMLWFWEHLRLGAWRSVVLYAMAMLAAALFVSIPPKSMEVRAVAPFNTGLKLLEANRLERAGPLLEEARQLAPWHAEVNLAYGNWALSMGRELEALGAYGQVLADHPGDLRARHNAGLAFLGLEKWEEAEKILRGVLADDPGRAATWYLYAAALGQLERPEEARRARRMAVELAPEETGFREPFSPHGEVIPRAGP